MAPELLHEIFEVQAQTHPDSIAVIFGDRQVTWSELEARANQVARYLRKRGATRNSAVAMLLPRSVDAYAAILGTLKAGAAYVPIDPGSPTERTEWIIENSGAVARLTEADLEAVAGESTERLPSNTDPTRSRDLCYLIYTSGSTGRPKGVMVEHRNACHLVEAERRIFGVRPDDRVYQGASLTFDLSVEEMWLAFAAGATLIPATSEMVQAGPDLARWLAESRVSVLSCVPTLLSLMNPDSANLRALRLLILGGEQCPSALVDRWARRGRRIVNTYGPTESTVTATFADLCPGKPVTIGRPVPGYRVYILNENLNPVAPGQTGEIFIAGTGVARGYWGRDDETRMRFLNDPFSETPERMYRSGDLGRFDDQGNIEFIGRIDRQVKLRGLRLEPGEIESALLRNDDIQASACAVHEGAHGAQQLIAWVVPRSDRTLNEKRLLAELREWLPAWMVPSHIEVVAELPRLANGKLDRSALAVLTPKKLNHSGSHRLRPVAPPKAIERKMIEIWSGLFQPHEVSVDDDFFLDLGGHSLLAAWAVSALRKDSRFASLTVRDVYSHPTISRLAAALEERTPLSEPKPPEVKRANSTCLAGCIQSASLYFVFALRGAQWIAPWLVYFLRLRNHSPEDSALWALTSAVAVLPAVLTIAICAKWAVLGRIKAGRYRLWGAYYLRWWFVQTLIQSVPLGRLGGTPLLPFVYRLLGVRIGPDVHIATDHLAAFDLISVGDGASIDEGASLFGYSVANGELAIGPISIGRNCLVGTGSVVGTDVVMEDSARLEDLSLLPNGLRIPAGETWAGSPAKQIPRVKSTGSRPASRSRLHRCAVVALYAALVLFFPLIDLSAFLPGVALLSHLNPAQAIFYLAAPLAGGCFILCVTMETVLLKWLLIGRAREGRYPVHGSFYIRNWIVEQLLAFAVDVAGPLHATLFLKPWYRALGAKLGRFAEVSTASTTTPDLLDIGEDCTIADEVSLGAARVEKGWLTLAPTRLGRRTFVGNNAVIPAGTTLGAESLIGVLTVAPANSAEAARAGAAWLGSPPIFLPKRQPCTGFSEQSTFRPTRRLQIARACWEVFRVTLPGAGFITATVTVLDAALKLWGAVGPCATLLMLPVVFAACCAAVILAVVPVKWLAVGRYTPFEKPFWSAFVWRLELVNALFEFLATPIGLETLRGTPLLAAYLRLLGCRIGRAVYIDSTGFLEFDLVEVGDRAILNKDCILQTHLFEDRVLKGARVRIGADCEIGSQSVVLYDSEMKDGARLGSLSLLMKGEVLPAGQVWVGSPLSHARETEPVTRTRGLVA
jgi:non-ribosomal peptide synthetase-like protein